MQRFICLLLLVFYSGVLTHAQTKGRKSSPPPKRIEIVTAPKGSPNRYKTFREDPRTVGLSIEKYVSTHDVNADGTAVHLWEMERKCSNAVCMDMSNTFKYVFNNDLQRVEVIEANIVKPDGKKIAVPARAVTIKPTPQAEAALGFSSLHEVAISFDGLKVGESSQFILKIRTTKAMFDNHFDAMETFPLLFDWKSIEINLSAPKNYTLHTEAIGLDGGPITEESGRMRWQWKKQNIAALEIEPAMYDISSASPRFAATSFKDYNDLGNVFWNNVKAKAIVTPEVQSLADEITKNVSEPKQQAQVIYDWVNKNIRYVLVVLDRGGWNPHSTTEILANRYGDCKDYTTIIYALLKAKGIESTPVLIRSDFGNWFPAVATPDYFNHAVLYIPSLKLIADATAPNTRLGLIPQTLVGKKAVLSGEQTGIIEIPDNNPDDNQVLSEIVIEMLPNGSLRSVSRNTYKGRMEILFRPLFGNSEISKNSEIFVKVLLSYFGVEGSGKIRKIGDPFKVDDAFSVELEAAIPHYTTFSPRGKLTLPVGINLNNTLELEQLVTGETRKTNLVTGAIRMKENFVITLPETVSVESLPPAINFKNQTGMYRNEFTLVDGKVHVVREIVIFKDVIVPSEYAQVRELVKKAVDGHNAEISYRADPSLLRAKAVEIDRSKGNPKSTGRFADFDMIAGGKTLLPAAEVLKLETKLKTAPDDIETRKRLLRNYSSYEIKVTPKTSAARLNHRLWFVKNRPELDQRGLYGFTTSGDSFKETELEELRAEWLRQVAADENNVAIRQNAVEFLRSNDNDNAIQLLEKGIPLHPEKYEFRVMLINLLQSELEKEPTDSSKRLKLAQEIASNGETALRLLKKERSSERDRERNELLINLCRATLELGKLERAKELATELIIEFGQAISDAKFDDSSHVANIVLGRIALRLGDTPKAKEHLLTAVRAPLRQNYASLSKIDTALAKELFDKGEKDIVLEYLRMCESLSNLKAYPESYHIEIKSLKAWQGQIKQSKKPSFEFGNDAPLP